MPALIVQFDFTDPAVKAWANDGKLLKGVLGKSSGTMIRMTDGNCFWMTKNVLKKATKHVAFSASDHFIDGESYYDQVDMLKCGEIMDIFTNFADGCVMNGDGNVLLTIKAPFASASNDTPSVHVVVGASDKPMGVDRVPKLDAFMLNVVKFVPPKVVDESDEKIDDAEVHVVSVVDDPAHVLLAMIGLATEGETPIKEADVVDFCKGLGMLPEVNATAALATLNAFLVAEGEGPIKAVKQLNDLGFFSGAVAVELGKELSSYIRIAPNSVKPPPRKRKPNKAEMKEKEKQKKKKDDSVDSDPSSSDSSASDSDEPDNTKGREKATHKKQKSVPVPTGLVAILEAAGRDVGADLHRILSSAPAEPIRKAAKVTIEESMPDDPDEYDFMSNYMSDGFNNVEALIGTDLYGDLDFSDKDSVTSLLKARLIVLKALEEKDEKKRQRGSSLDPFEETLLKRHHPSEGKPNKALPDAHVAEAVPSEVNRHLLDSLAKEGSTLTGDLDDIRNGIIAFTGLKGDDRIDFTRVAMSNGKVDAVGTLDPHLVTLPVDVLRATKAARARASTIIRDTVADGRAETLSYATVEAAVAKAALGDFTYKEALAAVAELKAQAKTKYTSGSHMEVNAGLEMLRDVMMTVFDTGMSIPNFGVEFARFFKNATQTSAANGVDPATRATYISKVLLEWQGVIRRFRAADTDEMPRFSAAVEANNSFFNEEITVSRLRDRTIGKERIVKPPKAGSPKPTPEKTGGRPTDAGKPPDAPDPNRPVNGHAVFSAYKTRKFVPAETINTASDEFRKDNPTLCSSFNLRTCKNKDTCKFTHSKPSASYLKTLSDKHGLDLTY